MLRESAETQRATLTNELSQLFVDFYGQILLSHIDSSVFLLLFFRQQSEDLGTERGIIFFRCFSRLLRNDFFAFAFIAWKFFISYALFRHNSSRLLAERTEKMFSRRKKKKQLATRKCLPMMTINILMRNANELTSTCYKSCYRTATSLQLRPVKKKRQKIQPLSVGSLLPFLFRVSLLFVRPKKRTQRRRTKKNDLFCIMNKEVTMQWQASTVRSGKIIKNEFFSS